MKSYLQDYLEEISEVLFFKHRLFGLAFLAICLFFNFELFIFGIFSSVIGFIYTKRYRTPKILRDGGLITINALFFGIAMSYLFQRTPQFYLCLLIGSFAIPIITKTAYEILQHWKLSPYIIPYIAVVWIFCLGAPAISLFSAPEIIPHSIWITNPDAQIFERFLWILFTGIGRIFFLPDPAYGLVALLLVMLFSLRKGLYFFAGAAVATVAIFLLSGQTSSDVDNSIYVYSAGLVGLGLASMPEKLSWQTILLFCLLSVFFTMALTQLLDHLHLPTLSLPFVITLWITLLSRVPRLNVHWAPASVR